MAGFALAATAWSGTAHANPPEPAPPDVGQPSGAAPADSTPADSAPAGSPAAEAPQAAAETSAAVDPDATKKKVARDLGYEGVELFQAGRFAEAAEKFERAYRLQPVPTLGSWSARSLERQGLLVESSERYVEVLRYTLNPGDPEVYTQALRDANSAYEQLQKRIPKLGFQITGADPAQVQVQVDGKPLPADLLGVALPTNPGKHRVLAVHGDQQRSFELSLAETENRTLQVNFEAPAAAAAAPPPEPTAPPPVMDEGSSRAVPATAWIAWGIGAVGLSAGLVMGISAADKQDKLETDCGGTSCPDTADFRDRVDEFDRQRVGSLVSYGIGAAGLAVGTVIWLTAGRDSETQVGLSPTGVRLRGQF